MKIWRLHESSNLLLIGGVSFIAISPLYFYGALSVQIIDSLEYKPSLHGLGATSFYLFAAVLATSLGRVADQTDPVSTLKISMSVVFVTNIGLSVSNSLQMICFFLAFGGIANAFATLGVARFVQDKIEMKQQGLAYGVKQSATGLPTLVAAAAIPFVATSDQWRLVFAIGSIFPIIILKNLHPLSRGKARISFDSSLFSFNFSQRSSRKKYTFEIKLISVSFGLGAAVGAGLITFLPVSNVESGLSVHQSSFAIVLASFSSFIIRFGVLLYMDRTEIDAIKICIFMMAIGAIGFFGLSTMKSELVTFFAVMTYAFGWGWVGLIAYKMLRISSNDLGSNVGLMQTAAALGSVIGPAALGYILEFSGFQLMWTVCCAALIASLAFLIFSQLASKSAKS